MLKQIKKNLSKVYKSSQELINKIKPGMTLMTGGFGVCGIPTSFIRKLS